jgi:hypothetical protein
MYSPVVDKARAPVAGKAREREREATIRSDMMINGDRNDYGERVLLIRRQAILQKGKFVTVFVFFGHRFCVRVLLMFLMGCNFYLRICTTSHGKILTSYY